MVTLESALFAAVCAASLFMAVPNMAAFGSSMRRGLQLIDWFYPWPQNHSAYLSSPLLLRGHILGNGAALLIGLVLLHYASFHKLSHPGVHQPCQPDASGAASAEAAVADARSPAPPDAAASWRWWVRVFYAYVVLLVTGSSCSLVFSARNAAHKLAGTVSFGFMAAGAVVPATAALYCATSCCHNTFPETPCDGGGGNGDDDAIAACGRAHVWFVRSFAALFGAGVRRLPWSAA
jgi:hypothetical protein